jgi:hypothetical protein
MFNQLSTNFKIYLGFTQVSKYATITYESHYLLIRRQVGVNFDDMKNKLKCKKWLLRLFTCAMFLTETGFTIWIIIIANKGKNDDQIAHFSIP